MKPLVQIQSRDNPLLKSLRQLARNNTAYRSQNRIWVEGDHLAQAAISRGVRPALLVLAQSSGSQLVDQWRQQVGQVVLLPEPLLSELSTLESPTPLGFVIDLPVPKPLAADCATVILDRLQDAGNVGAILRSASAFGFTQVIALKGSAALWSPKVVRAGMGAHWGLSLHEGLSPQGLEALRLPMLVTSSHQGADLHQLAAQSALPMPCAWVFGHEGQGVSAELRARASKHIRIAQPGGEESLNVSSAAAICLHASATQSVS